MNRRALSLGSHPHQGEPVYPSNLHMLLRLGAEDPRHRADYVAAALRHREAGRRAVEALPALPDRLRAGVRVVTTRRVVVSG